MNRVSTLVALIRGHLAGDKMATTILTSADYGIVLDSIEADAARYREAELVRLDAEQPREFVHLIVGRTPDEAFDALRELRQWLRGAKRVTVCDPYLFRLPTPASAYKSTDEYAESIISLFDKETKDVQVFC